MAVGVGDVVGHARRGGGVDPGRQRHEHRVRERHGELVRDDAAPVAAAEPEAVHRDRGDGEAVAGQAGGTVGARRMDAPRDAVEDRLDHHAAGVAVGDDLVAGHEGERHDRFEVAGRLAVDRRQVRAADAGQAGSDAAPAGAGKVGLVEVGEPDRTHAGPEAGDDPAGDAGRAVAGQVVAELEGPHPAPNW